jgi:hypothetical protein
MKSNLSKSTKKSYKAPELFVYGDISEITRMVGDMGGSDGGMGTGMTKSMV